MQLGTVEPALRYHAGMIELAAGDSTMARQHLAMALGRRRALSVAQVAGIRHALKALGN